MLRFINQYDVKTMNRIGGVMVSVLASSEIDQGFSADPVKPKTTIGVCCFFAKHAALRRKSKDWLARNQDNVSDCCFSELALKKSNSSCWGLEQSGPYHHLIEI
jgi:hypothetical protein